MVSQESHNVILDNKDTYEENTNNIEMDTQELGATTQELDATSRNEINSLETFLFASDSYVFHNHVL